MCRKYAVCVLRRVVFEIGIRVKFGKISSISVPTTVRSMAFSRTLFNSSCESTPWSPPQQEIQSPMRPCNRLSTFNPHLWMRRFPPAPDVFPIVCWRSVVLKQDCLPHSLRNFFMHPRQNIFQKISEFLSSHYVG